MMRRRSFFGAIGFSDSRHRAVPIVLCFLFLALMRVAGAQENVSPPPNNLVGTWTGRWVSVRGGGAYEFDIQRFDGERLIGRVNSEAQDCTVGWTGLSGKRVGEEIHATYVLGGRCRQVDVVFPIPKGDVIEGRWSSQYPGYGTFRLTKKN